MMAIFISAATPLSKCSTLGDQIRVRALRIGGGWQEAKEELATLAEEWFGPEPSKTRKDFRSVCLEVFRAD